MTHSSQQPPFCVGFDLSDADTSRTIKVELKSGRVRFYINSILIAHSCSQFNWWYRLTYRLRSWLFWRRRDLVGSPPSPVVDTFPKDSLNLTTHLGSGTWEQTKL